MFINCFNASSKNKYKASKSVHNTSAVYFKDNITPISLESILSSKSNIPVNIFKLHNFDKAFSNKNILVTFVDVPFTSDILLSFTTFVIQSISLKSLVLNFVSTFVCHDDNKSKGVVTIFISLKSKVSIGSADFFAFNNIIPTYHYVAKSDVGFRYVTFTFGDKHPYTNEYFITNVNKV